MYMNANELKVIDILLIVIKKSHRFFAIWHYRRHFYVLTKCPLVYATVLFSKRL